MRGAPCGALAAKISDKPSKERLDRSGFLCDKKFKVAANPPTALANT